MIKKMRKKIYVAPRLEILLFDVEPVLGDNSIPIVDGDGEDLSKENIFDSSDYPVHRSIWDEDEE